MLVHLAVNNYAIVEHLELELGGGMTVVTGETGAGKSIMLDALALTLGDRADSGAVRPGANKADLLATFDISDIPEARQWLDERDLASDDQVILRRVVTAEGRSRGYINGSPCPQQDLKALGEMLIDIHSQHEHQSLLKPDTHRRMLDAFAGAGDWPDRSSSQHNAADKPSRHCCRPASKATSTHPACNCLRISSKSWIT